MINKKVLIVLWTTSKCNLKCKYCYAAETKEKTDMDFQTATKVLDSFKDSSMKIQFSGGEPLLNYSLIRQIYAYVKAKGYKASFQMQTNGTLIDLEMAKELKDMKIAIGVSMDGPPDINEHLRGKTAKLMYGISSLARAGLTINLNSVVSSKNVSRLPELADVALYFGNVDGIGLDLLRNIGRAKENCNGVEEATSSQLREALILMYERCEFLYSYSGKKIYIRCIEEAKKRLRIGQNYCNKGYCYASYGRSFVVLPNGDIYPCGSMTNYTEFYMGNIHQDEVIKQIALPTQSTSSCVKCKYHNICTGGCPSRLIVNNDSTLENTLDCILKKCSFEIAEKSLAKIQ